MHPQAILDRVSQELVTSYSAHTILLYGSHADGSAGLDSDYDIAAFAPIAKPERIARFEAGTYLDMFVYPEASLLAPSEEFLRLRGAKVLRQRASEADAFLQKLEEIYREGPKLLPPDEIAARKTWAHKMVARIERKDPEGNYRRAWLLQALLEDLFHIRGLWYEGPKKALQWLSKFEPSVFEAFRIALEPGASDEAIGQLVTAVVGPPDAQSSPTTGCYSRASASSHCARRRSVTMKVLGISGSLRKASINSALLRAAKHLAPPGLELSIFDGVAQLPLFNPDLEASLPSPVVALHSAVAGADALLLASPEYAHGVTGAIKNTLDWLVSFEPFVGKPVAVLNASPRAHHSDAALRETLRTMSAIIIEPASLSIPLLGAKLDENGMIEDEITSSSIKRCLAALQAVIEPQLHSP